ncbi:hypothetical protein [Halomonas tibetensis]|uniref:Organic solvent tolerance-like N-terminal domain-containing protein n=1 Tax=Halomonas tibetensis TaxID=2259590 RepID=A0ABV7B3Z8_9GAMM
MTKTPTILLLAALFTPSLALAATLELPTETRLQVQVIDSLFLNENESRLDDILIRPAASAQGSHELPSHCVMVGDALIDGERVRITTKSVTCIATQGSESEIYSGDISAAAYDEDGSFGIAACEGSRCEITPEQIFELRLASDLVIEEQENTSEQINIQRRQLDDGEAAAPSPTE